MTAWLDALTALQAPAVLVTVAAVQGSVPREAGARMVVTADRLYDTIGGGHLELRGVETARAMLAAGGGRKLERFPLGPSLGQCCGGVVQLLFEHLDAAALLPYRMLAARWQAREDSWRLVPVDGDGAAVFADARGQAFAGAAALPDLPLDRRGGCRLLQDADGRRWLADPLLPWRAHLVLFGAGHVGAAIVRALAALPCHVTWVDEREEMFPAELPANVRIEATDLPEAVVAEAPAGSSFLVMTHSHALDQLLCEHILRRTDFSWFGLIGSETKRAQFERRLRERGIADERLAEMTCPVGIPGIGGKMPAVIAASVAAQLLQVWEAAERAALAARPLPQHALPDTIGTADAGHGR